MEKELHNAMKLLEAKVTTGASRPIPTYEAKQNYDQTARRVSREIELEIAPLPPKQIPQRMLVSQDVRPGPVRVSLVGYILLARIIRNDSDPFVTVLSVRKR